MYKVFKSRLTDKVTRSTIAKTTGFALDAVGPIAFIQEEAAKLPKVSLILRQLSKWHRPP